MYRERERVGFACTTLPMIFESPSAPKRRRRFTTRDGLLPMDLQLAKAKFEAAKLEYGREIRVFESSTASSRPVDASEEPDEFFDLTAEDYYRILATKKEDKLLKTRKIREAEEAARKPKTTKAVIRVRFPDNYTLEAIFHPSEAIESLFDLLKRVAAQPHLPFYLYTTPPKKRVEDLSQNFYSAGFVPGAIVYFSYDLPNGDNSSLACGTFLKEDVLSLKDLEFVPEQEELTETSFEPETKTSLPTAPERKYAEKRPVKPKWLKL